MNTFSELERNVFAKRVLYLAGIDEVGRGPLAGPVVAAAVIFPDGTTIDGIADSKTLERESRETLAEAIRSSALCWSIGMASVEEIDAINILNASILAMHRAVQALSPQPEFLLVDGNRFHHPSLPFQTVIDGDSRCFTIAAASILAKVHRDRLMEEYAMAYPEYGFETHKGYATRRHIDAMRLYGSTPIHRRTFTVKQLIPQLAIFPGDDFEPGTSETR